jgi:uncharacterized protein YbjT (DUF2867 family)
MVAVCQGIDHRRAHDVTKENEMRIAVAGATGRAGRHVADILEGRGHDVVRIARSAGVDVITAEGLAEALEGAECIVDLTTGPSPDEEAATAFFTTATRNLQERGHEAGVERMVVVSIVGIDRFDSGYNAAKLAQEEAVAAGPIPARILRATQFHEFVGQLVDWGRRGEVADVPNMRTQLVAARTVAEALADLAADRGAVPGPTLEIGGPREESLVEAARLLMERRGDPVRIEGVTWDERYEAGAALPGPGATLAGPTFAEWLDA